MRIISLAPTQTEIIAALGAGSKLIGRTEDCDFPPQVRDTPTFGTWYAPDLKSVLQAKPDLVCTFGKYQEESAAMLSDAGIAVYHGDAQSVRTALESFADIAELIGCPDVASRLLEGLQGRLQEVNRRLQGLTPDNRPSVLRIMNWEPFISVGPGAFQHDVIRLAGGRNVMEYAETPYPIADPQSLALSSPDAIFFCEPHIRGLLEQSPVWRNVRSVLEGAVFVFDCGLTCRSGPRIVDMVEALSAAIHPDSWL